MDINIGIKFSEVNRLLAEYYNSLPETEYKKRLFLYLLILQNVEGLIDKPNKLNEDDILEKITKIIKMRRF